MNPTTARTRATARLVGLLAAGLVLTSCATGAAPAGDAAAPAAQAGYPVSIDTAYGGITVERKPERIVVLNGRHLELLDLLDETPVAYTDYGATDAELVESYPWMAGTLPGEADPALFVGGSEPSAEAIAAYEPDLILTTIWQTDEPLYQQLSQIAPTYVGTAADGNTSWQDDLGALARLTGNDPAIVDTTQAELDTALADAAARLPGLQGATFHLATLTGSEQFTLTEYGVEPVLGLGLVPAQGQPSTGGTPTDLSFENVDSLDGDVVFVSTRSPEYVTALRADPRVATLPASRNGTLVYFDSPQWVAINGGTAVSERWWLEQIVPVLEASALNRGRG